MILFDMDLLLPGATEAHRASFRRACEEFGVAVPDESLIEGEQTYSKVRYLQCSSEIKNLIVAREAELSAAITMPRDVAKQRRLALLKTVYPYTVVTNTHESMAKRWLQEAFGVAGHNVLAGGRPKPHPNLYEQALFILECPPREAWVFEETDAGVLSAKAAGANVIRSDRESVWSMIALLISTHVKDI
jgi:beta-phosphoglucomutase-like phosphatase (HAD superfamily)